MVPANSQACGCEKSNREFLVTLAIVTMVFSVWFSSSLPGTGPIVALGQPNEATVFFDGFESYNVGTFYPLGGWQFGGSPNIGSLNITDLRSYSGAKSLLMNDSSVLRWFGFQAQSVGYEVAVYSDGRGEGSFGVMFANRVGFLNPNYPCGHCFWAGVDFLSPNMSMWAGDGNHVDVVQSWKPGVWYIVKVILSAPADTYDVWINGTLVAENLQSYWPHGELVDSIILQSHTDMNVFFDNVRVFAVFFTNGLIHSTLLIATAGLERSSSVSLSAHLVSLTSHHEKAESKGRPTRSS
jgi:hypothetical protein